MKAAEFEPWDTATCAGVAKRGLVLERVTKTPSTGAALVSVATQALVELDPRVEGLQATEETCAGATRPTVAVCEMLPRVAVIVAF